ncbi:MAG: hypothetical protein ABIT37_21550 [Luteolibacter sp.]
MRSLTFSTASVFLALRTPVFSSSGNKRLLFAAIGGLGWAASCQAVEWKELTKQPGSPTVVAFNNLQTPPKSLPFLTERKKAAGFWAGYTEPAIIAKLAETATVAPAGQSWEATGLWMHAKTAKGWVSLPVFETKDKSAGSVKQGETHVALHAGFWNTLQPSRPESAVATPGATKARTGGFNASLGERVGTAQSPDDRQANPFYKYDGDATKETAGVFVPPAYNGSEAYGLIVSITPSFNVLPKAGPPWTTESVRRKYIWVAPGNIGNNQPGNRRVWLAQQARAWALHHYRIDPSRCIISGSSNGADAASATAVATPFGFNAAFLFAPPCSPALGTVSIPMEGPGSEKFMAMKPYPGTITPLSSKGIDHIRKNWRFAYVVGTKDSFLPYCRNSVNALLKAGADCELFEIPNMGHGGAIPSIAEYLDYLESPRMGKAAGVDEMGIGATKSAMIEIGKYLSANDPAKARERLAQLWNNYPSSRTNPELLALIVKMEALP